MFGQEVPQWRQLTDEILSGMKEWRKQHPKATFYEIERETMKRMASCKLASCTC